MKKSILFLALFLILGCVKSNPVLQQKNNDQIIGDSVKIEFHLKQGKCEIWNPELKDSIVTAYVDSYALQMVVKNYVQDSLIDPVHTYTGDIFFGDTIQIVTEKIPDAVFPYDRQRIYKIRGTDSILCIYKAVPKQICFQYGFGNIHFIFKPEVILIAPVDTAVYLKCNSKYVVMKEINSDTTADTLFIGTINESIRL